MAEQIIDDLKKAGSENMGNLIGMMKQFKDKEANTKEEIEKLSQLTLIKDDEMANLDIELRSLNDFLNNVRQTQGDKILMYKQQIEDNKLVIKRQDKLIVDLQQRNELSQVAVTVTQDQVGYQNKEKDMLSIKMQELNDQRVYF
jgi:hypothetical protein